MEDGYEFFAKRQLVTLFSAPNYCGEFDNAGAMMSVDETLMCSFQVGQRSVHSLLHVERTRSRALSLLDFKTIGEEIEDAYDVKQSSSHTAA